MEIHCIITGQNEAGRSAVIRAETVKPVTLALLPGYEFHRLWGSDAAPELPSNGTAPPHPGYFPMKHGFRFGFFTIPPDTVTNLDQIDTASAFAEIAQKLPGMMEVLEPDHPGMHTTDTVDFDVVVFGEVYLELDDGAEVLLKAGDCVVQNGTRHAWRNKSAHPCLIAVTLVGAGRQPRSAGPLRNSRKTGAPRRCRIKGVPLLHGGAQRHAPFAPLCAACVRAPEGA